MFVAGTAAWSGFWLSIAETTGRAGYRATAIDLPPFGFSERSASGAYSRVDQAERLHALVVALGLKRPTIVGHSFGAGAVVEYAFRYPEEIGAMVLVDAALGLPDDERPPAADPAFCGGRSISRSWRRRSTSATLVNVWATRPLLAGLLYRKEAATAALVEIFDRSVTLAKARPRPMRDGCPTCCCRKRARSARRPPISLGSRRRPP